MSWCSWKGNLSLGLLFGWVSVLAGLLQCFKACWWCQGMEQEHPTLWVVGPLSYLSGKLSSLLGYFPSLFRGLNWFAGCASQSWHWINGMGASRVAGFLYGELALLPCFTPWKYTLSCLLSEFFPRTGPQTERKSLMMKDRWLLQNVMSLKYVYTCVIVYMYVCM